MITTEDLLSINYYKKEKFTGSYKGMRYLIRKSSADGADSFLVYIWPGPYNFSATDDSLKTSASFPFTVEGKQQAADWMNEQWTLRKEEWQTSSF